MSGPTALTTYICEAFAIKPRRAYRILAVGERLTVAEVGLLDRAERNLALDELEALSKVSDPEERLAVVKALAADPKARVAKVRRSIRAQEAPDHPVKLAVEEGFTALRTAWTRASKADRKNFLTVEGKAVAALLRELQEGGA